MQPDTPYTGNAFIDSMPDAARKLICELATLIPLNVRETIYEKGGPVDYAYFPLDGFISNVSLMKDGDSIEVGIIGREGMAGYPLILTGASSASNLYTQLKGSALRVSKADMIDIVGQQLSDRLPFLKYSEVMVDAVSQYAACNRLHTIHERFARWLCMAHDRVPGDDISLTHDFLALMLGVRRAGVTLAASTYQHAGMIRYNRGNIVVIDRQRLQESACECYDTVEDRFIELMGFSIRKLRTV